MQESTFPTINGAANVGPAADAETTEQKELRDIERQINDARERSAAVDAKRALKRKRVELDEAMQKAKEDETLASIEDEHGVVGKEIAALSTPLGLVVVKRAPGVAWHRFTNSKMNTKDHEDLVRACRVYPERDEFNRILEEYPAILIPLGNKIGVLYGLKREEDSGK